jgi:hypothetical protein
MCESLAKDATGFSVIGFRVTPPTPPNDSWPETGIGSTASVSATQAGTTAERSSLQFMVSFQNRRRLATLSRISVCSVSDRRWSRLKRYESISKRSLKSIHFFYRFDNPMHSSRSIRSRLKQSGLPKRNPYPWREGIEILILAPISRRNDERQNVSINVLNWREVELFPTDPRRSL